MYLGLDVGTSGCKALVLDELGHVLRQDYQEYDLMFPRPGWVELDPEVVWRASARALSNAARAYAKPLAALSIASFGEAAAMLDVSGAPVANSIYYTDARGFDCLELIDEKMGRAHIERRTGMPLNGMYTLPKLLWIQRNRPEWLDSLARLLPYGAYVAYKLTGEAATDLSLASRMLLLNRERAEWDDEILSAFGIRREWLPRLVPSGQTVGTLSAGVAEELGLPAKLRVVSGAHDQVAAAFGAGVCKPGDAADGIGTSECITTMLPESADLLSLRAHNICAEPYAVRGSFAALVFSSTAGAALKWFRGAFEEELSARLEAMGLSVYDALNDRMPDAPSPLLFLPYLAGTGTPHMDAQATGLVAGLTLSSTRADLYKAIIEGMNFEMRYNLELLGRGGVRVPALTAAGGGAASDKVLGIKADILGIPIRTLESPQSGAMGLAMLCAMACGAFSSAGEAAAAMPRFRSTIEPSGKYAAEYDEKYEQYLRMYPASRAIYNR